MMIANSRPPLSHPEAEQDEFSGAESRYSSFKLLQVRSKSAYALTSSKTRSPPLTRSQSRPTRTTVTVMTRTVTGTVT